MIKVKHICIYLKTWPVIFFRPRAETTLSVALSHKFGRLSDSFPDDMTSSLVTSHELSHFLPDADFLWILGVDALIR